MIGLFIIINYYCCCFEKGSSFQSLAKALLLNKMLTETADAPFLSP